MRYLPCPLRLYLMLTNHIVKVHWLVFENQTMCWVLEMVRKQHKTSLRHTRRCNLYDRSSSNTTWNESKVKLGQVRGRRERVMMKYPSRPHQQRNRRSVRPMCILNQLCQSWPKGVKEWFCFSMNTLPSVKVFLSNPRLNVCRHWGQSFPQNS